MSGHGRRDDMGLRFSCTACSYTQVVTPEDIASDLPDTPDWLTCPVHQTRLITTGELARVREDS